jgi:hypothetical protein
MEELALFNGELLPLGLLGPVAPACSSPEQQVLSSPVEDIAGPLDGFTWPSSLGQPSKVANTDVLTELLNSSSSSAASDELPEADWMDMKVNLNDLLVLPSTNQDDQISSIQTISDADVASLLEGTTASTEAAEEAPMDMLDMLSQLTRELASNTEQAEEPTATLEVPYESILSPVSLEDVESLLSSSPCSPQTVDSLSASEPPQKEESYLEAQLKAPLPPKRRGRPAPYQKETPKSSDRKQRKKQQNKDAALRYRMKKKEESCSMTAECDELEKRNHELKEKVETMTKEINYLKSLMAEVYKAKGLLKV